MDTPVDLPRTIPLFPLSGALLLPRSRLPLHIFEPRYLAMLDDALKTPGRIIGMIQPCPAPSQPARRRDCPGGGPAERAGPDAEAARRRRQGPPLSGTGSPGGNDRLQLIGCAGRVTAFSETEDGRYMTTLTGVCRFRLLHEVEGFEPYRRAEVDWTPFRADTGPVEHDPGLERGHFLDLLRRYFEARSLSTDWSGLRDAEDELLINALSMLCPFTPEERQALLEAPTLAGRREMLVMLFEFALRGGPSQETMQ